MTRKLIIGCAALLIACSVAPAQNQQSWGSMGLMMGSGVAINPSPIYLESLISMYTFNDPVLWTNASYGSGGLTTNSPGVGLHNGDGTISLTGGTSYTVSPLSLAPSNTGTIAWRVLCTSTNLSNGYAMYWINIGKTFLKDDIMLRFLVNQINIGALRNSVWQWQGTGMGANWINWTTTTQTWETGAVTWSNNDVRTYFKQTNGVVITKSTDATALINWVPTSWQLFCSMDRNTNAYAIGKADEIRFYNRIMSSQEVTQVLSEIPYGGSK